MSNVLKISDAASLALHSMVILAESPESLVTAKKAADELMVSEAHLSKVMQRLVKSGLIKSVRGPGGGFRLAKAAKDITLLAVYETIDGRLDEDECLLHMKVCSRNQCIMGNVISEVNSMIKEYLSGTNLAGLCEK